MFIGKMYVFVCKHLSFRASNVYFWNILIHSHILADSSRLNAPLLFANDKKLTITFNDVFSSVIGTSTNLTSFCGKDAEEGGWALLFSIINNYVSFI